MTSPSRPARLRTRGLALFSFSLCLLAVLGCGKYGRPQRIVHAAPDRVAAASPEASNPEVLQDEAQSEAEIEGEDEGVKP